MRVAIIQPWLPRYREGFYRELARKAREENIEIGVFFGETPPEWVARHDQSHVEWATLLPTRIIGVGSRSLFLKNLAAVKAGGPWDLIVVEQAVRNLETFLLMLRPASRRLAFWGHGRTYTEQVSGLQEKLKSWLTHRGDWFFAYTEGGKDALVESGFPRNQITVVNNSTDTESLREDLRAISAHDIEEYQQDHGLTPKTALYIGGLDRPKKIDFLLEAATHAHEIDPEFRLLIAGRGDEEEKVREFAASHPWAVYVGRVDDRHKALALKAAKVSAIPGRLGLAIVDGFVAGLPTVTTGDPHHPPEFEYLENGVNGIVVPETVAEYGRALASVLANRERLEGLAAEAERSSRRFSSSFMAEKFLDGFRGVGLSSPSSRRYRLRARPTPEPPEKELTNQRADARVNGKWRMLISYAADPEKGSEPGTGWGFIEAAASFCSTHKEKLVVILRLKDLDRCRREIERLGFGGVVAWEGLEISPRWDFLARLWGTRVGYLLWRLKALGVVRAASKLGDLKSIHQVTWGSATLPPVAPRALRNKFVWGPVALKRVVGQGVIGKVGRRLAQFNLRVNARGLRAVIAMNDYTDFALREAISGPTLRYLEPNVIVEQPQSHVAVGSPPFSQGGPHKLICAGRLIPGKRVDVAISALADARLRDFTLHIVGDGPLQHELELQVTALGLGNRVEFHRQVDRGTAMELMAGSLALLHPSRSEGSPWVIGEAATIGVPAIVFDQTGAETMVRLSENGGYIVPEGEELVEGLVKGVLQILSQPGPLPTDRWSKKRLPALLQVWWGGP